MTRNNYSGVRGIFFGNFFLEERKLVEFEIFPGEIRELKNGNAARCPPYAARFPLQANFTVLVAVEMRGREVPPINAPTEPSRRSEADGGQRIAGSRQRCSCVRC
jgi:hypothetical protein